MQLEIWGYMRGTLLGVVENMILLVLLGVQEYHHTPKTERKRKEKKRITH